MNEIDELQVARSRIRELEAALADAHMEYSLESAFLDIACGKPGTSAEELKTMINRGMGAGIIRRLPGSLQKSGDSIPDVRCRGNALRYRITDALMCAFAVFFFCTRRCFIFSGR